MSRTPWLERKYRILMAKWASAWLVITTVIIGGIGIAYGLEQAKYIAAVVSAVVVLAVTVSLILAFARLSFPGLFRSPPKSPDVAFLWTAALAIGYFIGVAIGLTVAALLVG